MFDEHEHFNTTAIDFYMCVCVKTFYAGLFGISGFIFLLSLALVVVNMYCIVSQLFSNKAKAYLSSVYYII